MTNQQTLPAKKAESNGLTTQKRSALGTLAERMGVEHDSLFFSSLRSVAFNSPSATNEQLLALCVVANQYELNPFTRELYAFPAKGGGIVPIVSVDGWYRIAIGHPQYDGCEIKFADEFAECNGKRVPIWCEVSIYRKDQSRPRVHREHFDEVFRNTDPWKTHPRRMLEHKAFIQTARAAFGFAGIYDHDEGERIIEATATSTTVVHESGTDRVMAMLSDGGPTPEDVAGTVDHEQAGEFK